MNNYKILYRQDGEVKSEFFDNTEEAIQFVKTNNFELIKIIPEKLEQEPLKNGKPEQKYKKR